MKWYQVRYRGPLWLWAILVAAIYGGLITLAEELVQGPAATITVEEVVEAQHSPQQ